MVVNHLSYAQVHPLSSELLHFQKEVKNQQMHLTWDVVANSSIHQFVVEIKSELDHEFVALTTLGANHSWNPYSFKVDELDTDCDYRLKLISEEGVAYSEVLTVHRGVANEVVVYPNPTNGSIRIAGDLIQHYQLLDVRGKTILSGNSHSNMEVEMIVSAELKRAQTGIYFLKVQTAHEQKTIQIRRN
ncbi:hypothetical protein BFP72_11265 [Reichenbachiella sp. 5M10]|nr:hypothetical protein BFP72_11265 [Reichenbachiella sp. 5M10]